MSTGFVITAFKTVPFSLLQRDLHFKLLAVIEAGRTFVLALSMIAFALIGLRYWTLVIGGLLSSTLSTGATLAFRRHRLAWPQIRSMKHAMTFSGHILVARLSWYVFSNADFLVAGRVLGKVALGLYEVGWTLASLPVEKITALVGQVTPAVFSAVQEERAALHRYLLRITEGLALVTFPISLGMALVAPDFIMLALGDKWRGAIVPLQLLSLSAAIRSLTPLLPQVLNVVGESRFGMRYGVFNAVVLPTAFYLMAKPWGTVGLALAWVTVYPLLIVPACVRVLRKIHLSSREYLRALWPAFSASVVMAASVLAMDRFASSGWSLGWRFTSHVVVGALAYIVTCFFLHRERISAFCRMVQAVRSGPPQDELAPREPLADVLR